MTQPSWRPIDTAPHDQNLLVFSLRWGVLIAEYSSEFRRWLPRMQCPVTLDARTDELSHWMPLPVVPEAHRRGRPRGLRLAASAADPMHASA